MTSHKGSRYLSKGIKRTTLSIALGMCFAGVVQAQSNTSGAISGRASAGDTIQIENPATGFKREITAGSDGSFRLSALPVGTYTVTRNGEQRTVSVSVGTASSVAFVNATDASTLETVTVVGSNFVNPIDFGSVESTTILTESVIDALPVQRNITDVALLAPGTTKGDTAFGNLASFGGATVGENAYYLNGFNITNFRNGLGGSTVPFEFYREFQVKTGGYGAEFGRSTGGVINSVSKSGSNEWHFGGNVIWEPDSLRKNAPNSYTSEGELAVYNQKDTEDDLRVNAYASGPIVKDKLFFFAKAEFRKNEQDIYGLSTASDYSADTPFWGLKLDWYITDNHHLEYTGFSDKNDTDVVRTPFSPTGAALANDYVDRLTQRTGGNTNILRYTGYFGDNFTASLLYGKGELESSQQVNDPACAYVLDQRSSPNIIRGCTSTASSFTGKDERDAYRADFEWTLGSHRLRFGYDREDNKSIDDTRYNGPAPVIDVFPTSRGAFPGGAYYMLRNGYVLEYAYYNLGEYETISNAYYLEDNWNITDNFLLTLGIRNETFDNKNKVGESFIKVDDQWAPRVGFSWDVGGEGRIKVFGNYGRYHLPVASNTNIRMAGDEYYALYVYDWDGTLDPTTGVPVIDPADAWYGDEPYALYGDGQLKDTRSLVNQDIKPMYQDEFILGTQFQLTDSLSAGVRMIKRDLKSTLEDVAIDAALNEYAAANGYEDFEAGGFDYYVLTNPGSGMKVDIDMDGDGVPETVELTAEQLGYPKSTRKYSAVEFFFERAWDGVWFLQGSYTWSRSHGNNEGYVRSDNGQTDAGLTTLFDQPGLLDGASGFLPNDRRHTVKVFGAWQFAQEWKASANASWSTGRPINCFGNHPTDEFAAEYGSESFYCGGVLVPRGTVGRTDNVFNLDLGLEYRPQWASKRLALGFKANNVLNRHSVVEVNEIGEDDFDPSSYPLPTYRMPTSYQSPRSVSIYASYDW